MGDFIPVFQRGVRSNAGVTLVHVFACLPACMHLLQCALQLKRSVLGSTSRTCTVRPSGDPHPSSSEACVLVATVLSAVAYHISTSHFSASHWKSLHITPYMTAAGRVLRGPRVPGLRPR